MDVVRVAGLIICPTQSFFVSLSVCVSLSCACTHTHTVLLCASGWPLSGAVCHSGCSTQSPASAFPVLVLQPSATVQLIAVSSFSSPVAACWSSACETDAMKSLARFLILDGFCCFGPLISRLNPWSFSRDRGVHCLESHLETMARLHLSLLLVQHCILRHLFFEFVFCFPLCR